MPSSRSPKSKPVAPSKRSEKTPSEPLDDLFNDASPEEIAHSLAFELLSSDPEDLVVAKSEPEKPSGGTRRVRRVKSNRDRTATIQVLPLIPVRDTVYFPHMIFSLFIGRDKSLNALESALDGEPGVPRRIILATQKDVENEDPGPDDIHPVGIAADVLQVLRLPDDTVRVMLEGGPRLRLEQFLQTDPFFMVRVQPVAAVPEVENVELEATVRSIVAEFERLVNEGRQIPPEVMAGVLHVAEPARLTDTIVPYLNISVADKQHLLETFGTRERLNKLAVVLRKENEILEVQKNIRSRVEKEMGDHQREFILREQMKAIRQELGDGTDISDGGEAGELREKIEGAGMPEPVKERALKELDRFGRTPSASPESGVIRNYLDWLVAMPWDKRSEDKLDLAEAEQILNEDHYGLPKVKERILEFLAVRKLLGEQEGAESKSPILCFVGPPGVGKTSLGKSVARALGRSFHRMSLGGVRDEAEIRGHRRTYIGALPGRIVQGLKQVGVRNPVFLLDEIDKIGQDFRGDPSSALLEALDPEQNDTFADHYLEVPFSLRDVLFVCTANTTDTIPHALRDRMEVISFSGYIEAEKLAIAQNYLVPKATKDNGLNNNLIGFESDALRKLIREYTREAGVRNLEREIGAISRKVARKVASKEVIDVSTVTPESLGGYLGGKRYTWGVAEEADEVGAVTGLVYTESGGDTVTIEVAVTLAAAATAEPRLQLTGQLGDVMKESAQTAWTFVRSRFASLGLEPGAIVGKEFHVHVPAGAVPKDGPSAGITMATALASAVSGRAVRKEIAMTGEITLRGKVLPVGGIKEKIIAAHRAGITEVLLPFENEKDLEELPADVRDALHFTLVKDADAVLKLALVSA
ncbi:MAG: endopeptidase La [Fibrella sp.]|nr:endopeptidase La [Armatimonadota bacterium]